MFGLESSPSAGIWERLIRSTHKTPGRSPFLTTSVFFAIFGFMSRSLFVYLFSSRYMFLANHIFSFAWKFFFSSSLYLVQFIVVSLLWPLLVRYHCRLASILLVLFPFFSLPDCFLSVL